MHIGSSFHSCCCIRSVVRWSGGGGDGGVGLRYETRYQIWPIDVKHEDDKITRYFFSLFFSAPPALPLLMAHNVVKFDCHYLQIQLASP